MDNDAPCIGHRCTEVVVLICCYNGKHHLDDLLPSLRVSYEAECNMNVVVVDDCSDDGSAKHIEQRYPWVDCVSTPRNYGFAGANNYGWAHIQRTYPGARYLVLLNQDTTVANEWITHLAHFLDTHPQAGAVQPKILLYDNPEFINTVGNRSHYLGFGLISGYRERDNGQFNVPIQCAYPSGCAVMLRSEILHELGLFDEIFHMYHEDLDLGWKIRQAGFQVWLVPTSCVYHKYRPMAFMSYYEAMERNRWIVLLTYYRCWTLIILAPAAILMEIGQMFFAAFNGLLMKKISSWLWFACENNLGHVLMRRSRAALRRKVTDRQFLEMNVPVVHLPTGDPVMLRYLGNPLCVLWWGVARHLL